MKNYKVIACKVMMQEMYLLAANSKNTIDILWMEQELHNTPDILRERVQQAIDAVEREKESYDAIILGYCLCSNGIVGLSSKNVPLVVPRGHDCITMLLGSKERYREMFDLHDGSAYWYSPGWIEHALQPGRERYEKNLMEYTQKYGEDNAKYLVEMEESWMREYNCAIYIDWECMSCPHHEKYTQECADYLGWEYKKEQGSSSLIEKLFKGEWDEEEFLIVPPQKKIAASYDERVIEVEE